MAFYGPRGGEAVICAAYTQIHAADPDDAPFEYRSWLKANPSLRYFPALRALYEREAADAKRDPSLLASFNALRLNQGTPDTEQATLLDADTWARIESDEGEKMRGREVYALGIDLGPAPR